MPNSTNKNITIISRTNINNRLKLLKLPKLKHKLKNRRLLLNTLKCTLLLVRKLKPLKNQRRKLIKSAITLVTTAIDLQEKVAIIPTKENNRINLKKAKKSM